MKMNSNVLKLMLIILLYSCHGQSNKKQESPYKDIINFSETADKSAEDVTETPKIEFEHTSYTFEKVISGEIVEHKYAFKNTGNKDLLILDTKSSCGCTVPEYDSEPIKPGEKSSIKVRFDTTGKKGAQDKKVTIFTNTNPNSIFLTIKGEIISND